ncbi:MAG: hypothetical protein ACPGEE_01160 [Opitutales bacterium]
MKEPHQKTNHLKNNYYRLKIEPFEFSQCDYLNETDLKKLNDAHDTNHLLEFKINPKFYTFCIKADQAFDEHVVVDIDDYVMTVMQFPHKGDQSNGCNEKLSGFAHSFAIPESIKLNEIKLYSKSNILLIIIPRV